LNSQINTITDLSAKIYDSKRDTEAEMKKKLYDLEKRWKDTQKLKMQLESEARNLENDNQKEM